MTPIGLIELPPNVGSAPCNTTSVNQSQQIVSAQLCAMTPNTTHISIMQTHIGNMCKRKRKVAQQERHEGVQPPRADLCMSHQASSRSPVQYRCQGSNQQNGQLHLLQTLPEEERGAGGHCRSGKEWPTAFLTAARHNSQCCMSEAIGCLVNVSVLG